MKKIPTLFLRDPDNRGLVLDERNPVCQWVFDGEGIATIKWDGTCVMVDDDGRGWARREVKPGKAIPSDFVEVDHDLVAGKRFGWVPIETSGFCRPFEEAVFVPGFAGEGSGTYELIGPKVNGDPHNVGMHLLERHGAVRLPDAPTDFDRLREWLGELPFEGAVWHHQDGRKAKIKRRDFGLPWPIPSPNREADRGQP